MSSTIFRKGTVRVTSLILFIFFVGCDPVDQKNSLGAKSYEPTVKPDTKTSEMIKKLDAAYANVDFMEVDYVMNGKKATEIALKLDTTIPGRTRNLLEYKYGIALVRAGKTSEAIQVFENLKNLYISNVIPNEEKVLADCNYYLAICYLRKAEQENCLLNHTNESCIIPISKKAQHINEEGSRKAIRYLEEAIAMNPFIYENQYLLNIAYMTLGQYPNSVPKEHLIPESYFKQNDFVKFHDIAMDLDVAVNEMSGGLCLDDFNNDGFLDIIVSSWGFKNQIRYFENDTKGGFQIKHP